MHTSGLSPGYLSRVLSSKQARLIFRHEEQISLGDGARYLDVISLSLRQSRPIARQSEVDVNSDQCCRLVDPMDFEFAVTGRACARHTLETVPEDRNRSVRYTLASRLGHERNHCSLIFSPPSPYSLDYPRSVLLSRIVVLN